MRAFRPSAVAAYDENADRDREVVALYQSGRYTQQQIAGLTSLCLKTVRRILTEHGVTRPRTKFRSL